MGLGDNGLGLLQGPRLVTWIAKIIFVVCGYIDSKISDSTARFAFDFQETHV